MKQGARSDIDNVFEHKEIIRTLFGKGELFLDKTFPANEKSLITKPDTPAKWRSFQWKRSLEIMPREKIQVFDTIDPNDIIQGTLGDCYFLSALSVLAERPKLIERLFITEIANAVGCYALWLNDNGEWRHILVDDLFPCLPNSNKPAFSRSNGPELWVLLLEKAYAKIYGGYDIIEGGHPALALRDLTGAPYDFLESEDPNEVWRYIKTSDEMQYLITCYTKSTEIREEQSSIGIIYGHAYSILDAKEVKVKGGSERIIKIRNPWGKFEWKGDWGDDSKKWTEDLKKQVDFVAADDGCFWMSVNDFVKYFEGVGICKFHENYRYKSISFDHTNSARNVTMLRLIIEHPTHIFLSVNQKDDRSFKENSGYDYSTVRLMIGKITPNGLKYIDGKLFCDRNVVLENKLDSGVYILTIEMNWKQKIHRKANISAYSEREVNFEEMIRADFNLVERNLLKSYVLTQPNVKRKTYADRGAPNIIKFSGNHLGILFFYYGNEDERRLREICTATKLENVKIQPPYKNSQQYTVEVLPKDDLLVLFKPVDENLPFAYAAKYETEILTVSYTEIQKNKQNSYKTTTYIDDPDDKEDFTRDNSYFDKYIMLDIDEEDIAPIEWNMPESKEIEKLEPGALEVEIAMPRETIEDPLTGKNLLDKDVWEEGPKHLTIRGRDLGKFFIRPGERNILETVDQKLNEISIEKYELRLYFAFLVLTLTLNLLKAQYLDITIMLVYLSLMVARFSNLHLVEDINVVLRILPYGFLLSLLTDVLWLFIYGSTWASSDIIDLGKMKGIKGVTITLSIINLFIKFLLFLVFWRKVFKWIK